jgi:hypothetical protein
MRHSPKISLRTEAILKLIANNLNKQNYTVIYEGIPWTKISRKLMAKIFKCTVATISHHIKVLVEENILLSQPIDSSKGDRTNFYAINPSALTNDRHAIFLSPIVKKLYDINRKIKSFNKSLMNLEDEKNSKNLVRKKTYPEPERTPVPYNLNQPKTTTAQDMLRIYKEDPAKNEKMFPPKSQLFGKSLSNKIQVVGFMATFP